MLNTLKENGLELVSDYKENEELRNSLFELAQKTFCIDFNPWWRNGFWGGNCIPYSIVHEKRVVANVFVNHMHFRTDEIETYFIQLGTVMTEEAYRGRGLIGMLVERIFEEYEAGADGIYLFANDSVLNFYPKFGFKRAQEYQYSKAVCEAGKRSVAKVSMETSGDYGDFVKKLAVYKANGSFCMEKNSELILFYLISPMKDCVYYIEQADAYVVAEIKGDTLLLHEIFSKQEADIDEVVRAFGGGVSRAVLGFSPKRMDGFEISVSEEEDTTLFIRGDGFSNFSAGKKRFPILSHA